MDLEQRLKEYEKILPDSTAYIWYSDVPKLLGEGTPSLSSFRRRMNEGKLHTLAVEGQQQAAFLSSDILKFLRGDLTKPRGAAAYRGKTSHVPTISKASPPTLKKPLLIDRVQPDDLLPVFIMEYEQIGMDAVALRTVMSWLKKNNEVYWLLSNPNDRKEVWATLCVLPLADEVILRLLRGEIRLDEITPDNILVYESGRSYSCYVSTIARPEHQVMLPVLARYVFSHWEKQPFTIAKLFALSHGETSPIWQKEFYFSLNYSASNVDRGDYVWELQVDFPNPCIDIQNLRHKQGENHSMITLEQTVTTKEVRNREQLRNLRRHRPLQNGFITPEAQFRRTQTDEDILEILRTNERMFGAKKPLEERLTLHRGWIARNPECSHVLEYQGKIVGYLTLLPLPVDTIQRIIRGEITAWLAPLDEIMPYAPGQPLNIYIQTLTVHPDYQEDKEVFKKFGAWLFRGVMDMFHNWGKDGVEVNQIFARSDTIYGQYSSIGLGFEEIPAPAGVHKRIFVMNVATSKAPFLNDYRHALEEYKQAHAVDSHV